MAVVATAAKAVMPKGRVAHDGSKIAKVVAVPKPNSEEFRKRDEAIWAQMSDIQSAIAKIQDTIQQQGHGREEFEQRRAELRLRLDDIRGSIEKLEEERTQIVEKLFAQNEQSRQKRSQAQQVRKDLQFATVEEIDQKIQELEETLISSTVPLKQEKTIVSQIGQLKRMKPMLKECATFEKDAHESEAAKLTPLSTQLDNIKSEILKLRERRAKEQERTQQIFAARAKCMEPVKELFEKKIELQGQLAELRKKSQQNREEHQKAEDAHRAYLNELQRVKMDHAREQKRSQDLLKKRDRLQEELEILETGAEEVPGLQLLRQTVTYLKKLVNDFEGPQFDTGTTTSPTSAPTAEKKVDEDFEAVIVPKKLRDDDSCQSKKKSGRKKGGKVKKVGLIQHDIKIFADFQELGIDPPLNYSDSPACLDILSEKLKLAQVEQAKIEAGRKVIIDSLRADLEALDRQERAECCSETQTPPAEER